jgi:hypothetical protein
VPVTLYGDNSTGLANSRTYRTESFNDQYYGYKVNNLFVGGINMATVQHSDVASVIQRNDGQMQDLLVAMRDKNASNGITR